LPFGCKLLDMTSCWCLLVLRHENDDSFLWVPLQPAERVIVFCNKIDTCRVVENALNRASSRAPEHGGGGGGLEDDDFGDSRQHGLRAPSFTVLPYHAAITTPQRLANVQVPRWQSCSHSAFPAEPLCKSHSVQ
jgi:hypothetical protein